jgi:ankyrin repeat protein
MTTQNPSAHRVEFLKKEAKQWLKSLQAGDKQAVARLEKALPDHEGNATLRTVQHAIAKEQGAEGWLPLIESIGNREQQLREIADEILQHAVFKDDPAVATRLYTKHPSIAKLDIYTAVAVGDFEEVQRRLARDSAAASRPGGPLNWPPIVYLAYMRLPSGADRAVDIARALLQNGADANSSWNDDWSNKFTLITGVIALGEGVQPPHPCDEELVNLFVEFGADPVDSQTFYNTSIVEDDTKWLEVLWKHSELRGLSQHWREVSAQRIGGHRNLSPVDFMLSVAVSYGHLKRAEWLLDHGANANSLQAYSGRRLRDEALVYGNGAMAKLLELKGAAPTKPEGLVAFQVACRKLERDEAHRLSVLHPEYLQDAELMLTAAREGNLAIIKLLLELGTKVDVANDDEIRALNLAAGNGHVEVVKLLLEHGADVDKPTKNYGGPMGFAGHFGHKETAALLAPLSRDVHNMVYLSMKDRLRELFSAEPELVNGLHPRGGMTPLFVLPVDEDAALEMAKFLLDHGADRSIRDQAGRLPAEAARKRGFDKVAELLK